MHVLSLVFLLRAFDNELKHLKLVFLHGSHVLHLLLVDALGLLQHDACTLVTLRAIINDIKIAPIECSSTLGIGWLCFGWGFYCRSWLRDGRERVAHRLV